MIGIFRGPNPLDVFANLLILLAFTLLAGSLAFAALILSQPALAEFRQALAPARRRLLWFSLLIAIFGTILTTTIFLSHAGMGALIGRYGAVLAVRAGLLALLAAWLWLKREESRWIMAPAALLLLTQSLLSHSAAEASWLAPVAADWVHFMFTSIWLGGVAMLALVVAPSIQGEPTRLKELGIVISRFSPLAMFSVFAIALTGLAQSASFVGSLAGLIDTAYGRAILIKVALLLVLVGFGAYHQQVISPRLQAWRLRDVSGSQSAARRFRYSILAETLVSLIVLIVVAVLTTLPLARDAQVVPPASALSQTQIAFYNGNRYDSWSISTAH